MKQVVQKSYVVLILLSCFVCSSFSHAFSANTFVMGVQAESSGNQSKKYVIKNTQHAAKVVKSAYGGKVLKVKKLNSKNSLAYRVKLVRENGHVISVVVDAKSGRIKGK